MMKPISDWMVNKHGTRYRTVLLDPDEESRLISLQEFLRGSKEDESLDINPSACKSDK